MLGECRTLWDEHEHKQCKAVALLSRVSAAVLYLFRLSASLELGLTVGHTCSMKGQTGAGQ